MQRWTTLSVGLAALPALLPAAAQAGLLIVDHQPLATGGAASDTAFFDPITQLEWQLSADQVPALPSDTPIARVVWWGFYGPLFEGPAAEPPNSETMRIRFHAVDPVSLLPGIVEHEIMVENPLRVATGRQIVAGNGPDEFRFEVEMTEPITLLGGEAYWIEIAQLGNADSFFGWEFSAADFDGLAFDNEITQGWRQTQSITTDLAYQLWAVPEPSFGLVLPFVFMLSRRTRGR